MRIGAQFYTIRDFCKDLDGFAESLKKVADIGYEHVQISGTCEYEPQWLADQLKMNGLQCVITHTPAAKLLEDAKKVAQDHDVFGCHCVGLGAGMYKFEPDDARSILDDFVAKYKPVAKALKENGKYFMYHNHHYEFMPLEGRPIISHIAEIFAPDEMGFTLDTYWVQRGGGDPAEWVERLAGREPCIHLKDHNYLAKMAVVGEGNINFGKVFQAAEKAGTEYMLVEQDDCSGENPFDCLKRSYDNLVSWGFR